MVRVFGLLPVIFALTVSSASAEPRLAVVDVKAVMDAVPEWTATVANLKKKWELKQSKLQSDQDALKTRKEQLDAKRVVSDAATVAKEEAELLAKAQELAQGFMQEQKLISAQELDLKDQMLKRIEPLVYKLAEEGDISYVFEKGSPQQPNVLYNKSSIDLTSAVIADYKVTYKNKAFTVRNAPAAAMPPGGL